MGFRVDDRGGVTATTETADTTQAKTSKLQANLKAGLADPFGGATTQITINGQTYTATPTKHTAEKLSDSRRTITQSETLLFTLSPALQVNGVEVKLISLTIDKEKGISATCAQGPLQVRGDNGNTLSLGAMHSLAIAARASAEPGGPLEGYLRKVDRGDQLLSGALRPQSSGEMAFVAFNGAAPDKAAVAKAYGLNTTPNDPLRVRDTTGACKNIEQTAMTTVLLDLPRPAWMPKEYLLTAFWKERGSAGFDVSTTGRNSGLVNQHCLQLYIKAGLVKLPADVPVTFSTSKIANAMFPDATSAMKAYVAFLDGCHTQFMQDFGADPRFAKLAPEQKAKVEQFAAYLYYNMQDDPTSTTSAFQRKTHGHDQAKAIMDKVLAEGGTLKWPPGKVPLEGANDARLNTTLFMAGLDLIAVQL